MALRKSTSRPIRVADVEYRWTFSDLGDVDSITVQSASGEGRKLVLMMNPNYIAEDGMLKRADGVTPAFVAEAITFAVTEGWRPDAPGAEFRMHRVGDSFRLHG